MWTFEPINIADPDTHIPPREGVYSVSFGDLNLNIANGLNLNCTRAIMWSPDGSPDQKFRLENAADGSHLSAMCSSAGAGAGKVLDAFRPGAAVEEGTAAEIYAPNDDVSQKLKVTPISNKYKISLQSNPLLSLTASAANAWVYHIAESSYKGTIQWCLNPDSGVSPNFVIGKKGQICEMVPVSKGAWCNGTSGGSGKLGLGVCYRERHQRISPHIHQR